MSNFDNLPPRPKQPCAKDCPRRAWDCHTSKCPDWMAYTAAQTAWRAQHQKIQEAESLNIQHRWDFHERYRRKRHK